jgi:hypothetical protein
VFWFWALVVLGFVVAATILLVINEWVLRRNDMKAAEAFPDDDDARATYALLRDFEGFGNPHWLSRHWAARRKSNGG